MSRVGRALLHLGTDVDADLGPAFDRWCEEHMRANLALPGFLGVRRLAKRADYVGVGENPDHLTLYDLEDLGALETEAYARHDATVPEPFASRIRYQRALFRELGSHVGASAGASGSAILHVTVDVDPAYLEPFLAWYAGQHVPAVLECPGMIGARRFENAALGADGSPPAGQRRYCTLYEMEDAGVIGRPEMADASRKGACPEELAPHRDAFNHVYEEIFRASAA